MQWLHCRLQYASTHGSGAFATKPTVEPKMALFISAINGHTGLVENRADAASHWLPLKMSSPLADVFFLSAQNAG